ncbi:alpha/beta hydrolase [Actinacidiphila oryziradicis]|uniref:Alpha/beta hydrolase n=1 Tax=Actinacidiphila oryziradicis TaxID=2571141 RepID=A0A4U0SHZ8_9ACTN|nr:alpha/beta hydrolase [Actinacidiphila oryziradicis]TKA08488.1 alpha/beta hydrolase [Actinacidiphila oryziradicis]
MTVTLNDRPRNTAEFYKLGATPVYASRVDQRFSYTLYSPKNRRPDVPLSLTVVIHGTDRTNSDYCNAFAEFAEENNSLILAPLFPGGIIEPGDLHNYKFIEYHGIRYDEILLAIIDEVAESYDVTTDRFLLFGFSGGGQFAHRFFLLHPDRLTAVSVGAPGRITQIDDTRPWWLGTSDIQDKFGIQLNLDQLRSVAVQIVVGENDTETWEINNPDDTNWLDGAGAAGKTRIERANTLAANFTAHGINARVDLVPGAAHEVTKIFPAARRFFETVIGRPQAAR